VQRKTIALFCCFVLLGSTGLIVNDDAGAAGFSPFNMMSPGRWMGGGNRYNDGYYNDGPGYGAPGYGYGAPHGYGAPGYGYGAPGYGYGAPGYGAPNSGYANPQSGGSYTAPPSTPSHDGDSQARIRELEQKIMELESSQQQPVPAAVPQYQGSEIYNQPTNPVFRPN